MECLTCNVDYVFICSFFANQLMVEDNRRRGLLLHVRIAVAAPLVLGIHQESAVVQARLR